MSTDPSLEPGGSNRLAAILSRGNQPLQPENAAARNRTGIDDSENIDPNDTLEALLRNGRQPGKPGAGSPGSEGDPRTSSAEKAGKAMGAMTTATVAAQVAVSGFTNNVLQANARLAEFSGEIATAVGQARARQIKRDIKQGQAIGDEYSRLDEANQEYRDMMTEASLPLQEAGMDVLAGLSEVRNVIVSALLPGMKWAAEGVRDLAKQLTLGMVGGDNDLSAARGFLSDLSDGKFDGTGTTYMNPGNQPLMNAADRRRIFGP